MTPQENLSKVLDNIELLQRALGHEVVLARNLLEQVSQPIKKKKQVLSKEQAATLLQGRLKTIYKNK